MILTIMCTLRSFGFAEMFPRLLRGPRPRIRRRTWPDHPFLVRVRPELKV